MLEVHSLLLDADGAVVGDELGHLAVQVPPGVLLTDGINSFLNPPMPSSVVHFYHILAQAWGWQTSGQPRWHRMDTPHGAPTLGGRHGVDHGGGDGRRRGTGAGVT